MKEILTAIGRKKTPAVPELIAQCREEISRERLAGRPRAEAAQAGEEARLPPFGGARPVGRPRGFGGSHKLRLLVPGAGLEPARPLGQQILSLQRLPFRHPG